MFICCWRDKRKTRKLFKKTTSTGKKIMMLSLLNFFFFLNEIKFFSFLCNKEKKWSFLWWEKTGSPSRNFLIIVQTLNVFLERLKKFKSVTVKRFEMLPSYGSDIEKKWNLKMTKTGMRETVLEIIFVRDLI